MKNVSIAFWAASIYFLAFLGALVFTLMGSSGMAGIVAIAVTFPAGYVVFGLLFGLLEMAGLDQPDQPAALWELLALLVSGFINAVLVYFIAQGISKLFRRSRGEHK